MFLRSVLPEGKPICEKLFPKEGVVPSSSPR